MEIIKNIFQIQSDTPFKYPMNTYFIEDEKRCLIDTSVEIVPKKLIQDLKRIGRSIADLDLVLISHPHTEHIASLNYIKQLVPDCQILAGPRTADYLENYERYARKAFSRLNDELDHRKELHYSIKSVKVDKIVREGDVIELGNHQLQVIETPGHCAEEVSFICRPEQILFSSDFIIGTKGETWIAIYPMMLDFDGDRRKYHASLRKIAQIKEIITLILPAHGPIIKNPKEKIEELLTIAPQIETEIIKFLETGPKTVSELVELTHGKKFRDSEKFYNATRRMHALLKYLEEEDCIRKKDGIYFKL